jgi:hypothetical protein
VYKFSANTEDNMAESYKRRHLRVNSLNLADVHILDNGGVANSGIGRTLNVSESGILLETHFPIDPNQQLALTLALGDDLLEIKGKVIYSRKADNGKYQNGIQFTDYDKPITPILKSFVKAFGGQQGLGLAAQ